MVKDKEKGSIISEVNSGKEFGKMIRELGGKNSNNSMMIIESYEFGINFFITYIF